MTDIYKTARYQGLRDKIKAALPPEWSVEVLCFTLGLLCRVTVGRLTDGTGGHGRRGGPNNDGLRAHVLTELNGYTLPVRGSATESKCGLS
jgi:hypothetical protein